ncbi:hypothetical protein LXL04_000318 [Taraxacum kok-saghyz]
MAVRLGEQLVLPLAVVVAVARQTTPNRRAIAFAIEFAFAFVEISARSLCQDQTGNSKKVPTFCSHIRLISTFLYIHLVNDLCIWLANADCSHQIWSACANMLNGDVFSLACLACANCSPALMTSTFYTVHVKRNQDTYRLKKTEEESKAFALTLLRDSHVLVNILQSDNSFFRDPIQVTGASKSPKLRHQHINSQTTTKQSSMATQPPSQKKTLYDFTVKGLFGSQNFADGKGIGIGKGICQEKESNSI